VPWVDETSSAEELVGGMVLDGPFDLTISEVIEPLKKEGPEVDTPRQCSAQPPCALGSGSLEIMENHSSQSLPRDDLGELHQWMGG